ncbi:T9SS type A sorting domain-containing protein [Candidatus Marinimicrobia bacterium]|nr:T9SS type A sorting domain-containing protein [Candidatus Neomarinimicrobiota bacterium]
MNFSNTYKLILSLVLTFSIVIGATNGKNVLEHQLLLEEQKQALYDQEISVKNANKDLEQKKNPSKEVIKEESNIKDGIRLINIVEDNNVTKDFNDTYEISKTKSELIKISISSIVTKNSNDSGQTIKSKEQKKIDYDQIKIDYYADLKVNPPKEDSYNPTRDCVDTNYDADGNVIDDGTDACADYSSSWCGAYDTDTFDAMDMCCICGGGTDDGAGDLYCSDSDGSAYTWEYAGAYASEVTWNLVDSDGNISAAGNGGTGSFCLPDGSYTANMYDSYGDGWNGAVTFTDSDGNLAVTIAMGACGYWDSYYELCDGSQIYADVTFGGPPPVLGCTDVTAENFDANADTDNGSCTWNGGCSSAYSTACADFATSGQCVSTSYFCDGDSALGNGSWGPDCLDGSDEGAACCGIGDNNYTEEVCAADCDGDIFGGAELDCLNVCDGTAEIDDCGICAGDGSSCSCDDLTVVVNDSYGDGWGGQVLSIGSWTNLGPVDGSSETLIACIDMTVANDVTVTSGSYNSEVSWSISNAAGTLLLEGGAPAAGCIGAGCPVYGCMLADAPNYNSDATIEDGSCAAYPGLDCSYYGYDAGLYLVDCNSLYCTPTSWLTDNYCDSAFECEALSCDGGDCSDDCAGNCGGGAVVDCSGECGGSAMYDDCGICAGDGSSCACDDLTVSGCDVYGDGWDGATLSIGTWSWTGPGAELAANECATVTACIDMTVANDVTMGGGSWASEHTWSISADDGSVLASGGDPYAGCIGTGCPVYGCMNPYSSNYSSDATADDGSCAAYAGADACYWSEQYCGWIFDCSAQYVWEDSDGNGIPDAIGDGICQDYVDANGIEYGFDCDYFAATAEAQDCDCALGWSSCLDSIVDTEYYADCASDDCTGGAFGTCNGSVVPTLSEECLNVSYNVSSGVCAEYLEQECPAQDQPTCADNETLYTLNMADSWGDGWNGNEWCANDDCATIVAGASDQAYFCLDLGTAYQIYCDGGSYQSEVSWNLVDDQGSIMLTGGAPYLECLGALCGQYCFDDAACNDTQFGACDFPPTDLDCDGNCANYQACNDGAAEACDFPPTGLDCNGDALFPAYTLTVGGGSWDAEISWKVDADSYSGIANTPDGVIIYLEDGAHTFTAIDSYGDGWNGATATLTVPTGSMYTWILDPADCTIGTVCEKVFDFTTPGEIDTNVYGCMLVDAPNYDADVTVDDGSCEFFPGANYGYWNADDAICFDTAPCDEYYLGCGSQYVFTDCLAFDVLAGSFYPVPCGLGEADGVPDEAGNGSCSAGDYNGNTIINGLACAEFACDGGDCIDCSGECFSGSVEDCNGDCDGTAQIDDCGICGGDSSSCNVTELTVTGCDSYGDSWNGATLSIGQWSWAGPGAELAASECATVTTSIDMATTFAVIVGGGAYDSEITWSISDASGVLLSGGAPYSGTIGGIEDVYGCMDQDACNYNPSATIDDQSCQGVAEGQCNCEGTFATGDINTDCLVNILDVVALVNAVIDGTMVTGGDINDDGAINVLDIVGLVNIVLSSSSRVSDATEATMIISDKSLSVSADGYIGGIQMTLSHDNGFELNLTSNALVAEYKTSGTTTTFVVVEPNEEVIFTSNQSFEIVNTIIANSSDEISVNTISEFGLSAAYPNPFNPSTTVSLAIPSAGHVSVKVYNLMGQMVGVLADGMMEANVYSLTWDANNFSSGVYLIRAESNSSVDIQKVLLVK